MSTHKAMEAAEQITVLRQSARSPVQCQIADTCIYFYLARCLRDGGYEFVMTAAGSLLIQPIEGRTQG